MARRHRAVLIEVRLVRSKVVEWFPLAKGLPVFLALALVGLAVLADGVVPIVGWRQMGAAIMRLARGRLEWHLTFIDVLLRRCGCLLL